MTNIYEEKDYDNALKLKKKLLTIYFIVLGVVFAIAVFLYLKFFFLPYESNLEVKRERLLYQVLMIFLFSLFAIFSFIYLGIPYKRARRYFIFLDDVKTGKKEKSESTFLQFENGTKEVGGVDYHVMVVLEWSDKTQEYMRRNVLVDVEKPLPKLTKGDIIQYTTHANVLLTYGFKHEENVFSI